MIRYRLTKTFLFFLILCSSALFAQQALEPLYQIDYLRQYSQEKSKNAFDSKSKAAGDTIQVNLSESKVIFKDDFSSYSGWPTSKFWMDNEVYINRSFGDLPVSIGVATFDGMDPSGKPYNNATPSAYGENDHLTSKPINLTAIDLSDPTIDSLYFSFYYQPQGKNPFGTEKGDSLILEFYDVLSNSWDLIWSVDGQELKPFRKATILIDPLYYQNGFQFRFTNFGNQTGNVDHWHIDYVYMTSSTLNGHVELEDMAVRNTLYTLLKEYTAMPWWHYNTTDMLSDFSINYYYFNKLKPKSPDIKTYVEVSDNNGAVIFNTGTTSPEFTIGFVGNKKINFPFNNSGLNNYPTNSNAVTNYFTYKVYYEYNQGSLDSTKSNDTIRENQIFGSYYAYDDGLPEAGFGVFGAGNELAYRFDIGNVVDTLTAVDMFFTPVVRDRSSERFQLVVWAEDEVNEIPGTVLYRKPSFDRPKYSDINIYKGIGNFVRYPLDAKVIVTGRFFVGWEKVTEERMNIGYDVNTNSQENIFINVGDVWSESDSSGGVVPGSLMLHPVFRNLKDPVVGIDNKVAAAESYLNVYPNPVADVLNVVVNGELAKEVSAIQLFDVSGRMVKNSTTITNSMDVSDLKSGIYFLRIIGSSSETVFSRKIIVK